MFLPMNAKEMRERGWEQPDFIYVSGDSYVDHPSFGAAIITRVLEDCGCRVVFLAQPNWKNDRDFTQFGKPRLGFMVSAGNIDSMVAHYTVAKRKRHDDAYTAGGKNGKRPDRAVTVYCNIIRRLYPDSPIIIGGLEASLRRFAHYDYWNDRVMPSILFDSKADILVYGMGELQTVEIAKRLGAGYPVEALHDIRGICYQVKTEDYVPKSAVDLPSYERVCESKRDYAVAARKELDEADAVRGKTLVQRHGKRLLVQNPPMQPLDTKQLDWVYALPYERWYPDCYEPLGGVPGIAEVQFSITHNRGCFGACNFCSLAFHQGRAVTVRSEESVLSEARSFLKDPRFKGYISDVGGRQIDGIKKVFIRSGIRFDYLMEDESDAFFTELVRYHISGQLRVAPEHCSAAVLDKMGKPHIEAYKKFCDKFYALTKSENKDQYVVPYLMSSHPGSTLNSTAMFYTELDPYTLEPVYVPKSEREKSMQRALLQYFIPENKQKVIQALTLAGRRDLIGNGKNCLVTPPAGHKATPDKKAKKNKFARYSRKKPKG